MSEISVFLYVMGGQKQQVLFHLSVQVKVTFADIFINIKESQKTL